MRNIEDDRFGNTDNTVTERQTVTDLVSRMGDPDARALVLAVLGLS